MQKLMHKSERKLRRPAGASSGATRKQRIAPKKPGGAVWLNRSLVLLGSGVVLAAVVKGLVVLNAIPVERIIVQGNLRHTQAEVVQNLIQPALVGGFLGADLKQVQVELESLPWIYRVSVRRVWPSALEVNVVEQMPVARWGETGLLNQQGEIFQSAELNPIETMPLLRGPEGSEKVLMGSYQRLVEVLRPLRLSVAELSTDDRGQLEAELDNGIELIIGGEDFLERVQLFVLIYQSDLSAKADQIERIDLRYKSGLAVAFSETSQVAGL